MQQQQPHQQLDPVVVARGRALVERELAAAARGEKTYYDSERLREMRQWFERPEIVELLRTASG
jgi:hypothetical protein